MRIAYRIKSLLEKTKENADLPNTIRIKLMGDGTRIARGLNVVNVAFATLSVTLVVLLFIVMVR